MDRARSEFSREFLAEVAKVEADKKLIWMPGGEATKYTRKFESVFGKGRYSWCAAFVTWCCEIAGLKMPIKSPGKFGYTFALCEAWQQWAIEHDFYYDNDGHFTPDLGDIVLFDWNQRYIDEKDNDWEEHIGIFLSVGFDGRLICADGNAHNQTNLTKRNPKHVQGYIRIPNGYSFPIVQE